MKYKVWVKDREDETLESSDESANVIQMLKSIAESYENDEPYRGSLEVCRPFTLAVNGAFESSATINQVPEKNLIKNVLDNNEYTLIKDISEILNVPLGTVKSRLHVAVKEFARRWKAAFGKPGND